MTSLVRVHKGAQVLGPIGLSLALFGLVGCTPKASDVAVTIPVVPDTTQEAAPDDSVAMQHITADRLYTIYSRHLIEGALPDQRFRGRPVEVTGIFRGINRDLQGKEYLELGTHAPDAFAYAEMSSNAPASAAALAVGTEVRLRCRGAGMVAGSPLLRDCRASE